MEMYTSVDINIWFIVIKGGCSIHIGIKLIKSMYLIMKDIIFHDLEQNISF